MVMVKSRTTQAIVHCRALLPHCQASAALLSNCSRIIMLVACEAVAAALSGRWHMLATLSACHIVVHYCHIAGCCHTVRQVPPCWAAVIILQQIPCWAITAALLGGCCHIVGRLLCSRRWVNTIVMMVIFQGEMIMQDRLEKERADAKNTVEEYVYDMRNKLCNEYEAYMKEEVSRKLAL